MAYIEPNSSADFFFDTGLSMSHENTLYFASESAKNSYFSGLTKVSVSELTYQRENRGWIRVGLPVSRLYNVDYMRFTNASFENKYFYAFVTQINYVNNITTEVQYVLDPLMTWMGTFGLKECYIDRQHTIRDGIGNNIADEGIPVGNYITEATTELATYNKTNSVARIAVADGETLQGTNFGIYSGCSEIDCASVDEIKTQIQTLVNNNQSESIVSIVMIPSNFTTHSPVISTISPAIAKPYSSFDGYVPRNNKLFCYPYKYCTVDNGEGSTIDFMYEYFGTTPDETSSGSFTFTTVGCGYSSSCEVLLFPVNYKLNSGLEYRLTMTHFPQCSFAVNSYEAYLAQKNAYFEQDFALTASRGITKIESNTGKGAISGALSGGIPGAIMGGANGFLSSVVEGSASLHDVVKDNLILNEIRPESPSVMHGTPSPDVMWSYGHKAFILYEKCITKNYAMMLDSYFDMYGYAVKQHGTPNMNARPHWTYVKTIGCDTTGNLPASDKKAIESIFDSGVRFWHNLSEMGNYSLDNAPAT